MTKELYDELKQIEDRLYNIYREIAAIQNTELGYAWMELYSYLSKVEVNDLE